MFEEEYYSNGKLLITGEYFVILGALALAVPLRFGQTLKVKYLSGNDNKLLWNTFLKGKLWFQAVFDHRSFSIQSATSAKQAYYIQQLLLKTAELNEEIVCKNQSKELNNYLDFSPEWGFGSSSSLISNMAFWIKADPFALYRKLSDGSGYDIACARAKTPIFYRLSEGQSYQVPVNFNPSFAQNLYFVYLGMKAHSETSTQQWGVYMEKNLDKVIEISSITQKVLNVESLEEFEELINLHETIMSGVLNKPTVKSFLFSDFKGSIKSLGAWGGDFVLVASKEPKAEIEKYFHAKGLTIIFGYNDIVL